MISSIQQIFSRAAHGEEAPNGGSGGNPVAINDSVTEFFGRGRYRPVSRSATPVSTRLKLNLRHLTQPTDFFPHFQYHLCFKHVSVSTTKKCMPTEQRFSHLTVADSF